MNIRSRITLLVTLTFCAIALIGGFAVYQSRSSAIEVRTVTQGVVPSALASAELVGQLKDVQLAVMAIVSAADLKLAAQAEDRLQATQARLQRAFDEQMTQADSDAQRGLVKQAKESLTNYFSAIRETVGFKLKGENAMAEAILAANVGGYLQEMEAVVDTLQIEKRRSKDDAIATLNANLKDTTSTIAVVTVIAILVLSGMGVLLYRQIIHPISEMEMKMTEIATSQDFSQRLPVHRMDEIGHSLIAFNLMVEKIEASTELVKQKTADINAMLHYIPQGLLTIEAGNRVHPEYSKFLESILETTNIAGGDLMEVVFANTNCSSDLCAQIDAATSACIGEDEMNFAFNSHLLATEVTKTFPNGRSKILDLNWSPITDESGVTLRVLLCLRDVTELRALEAAAHEQKRELAIIGEILGVNQEKFYEFIQGSNEFLNQNDQIISEVTQETLETDRTDVVNRLFRNMHTVKGNARTYGLRYLTNVVHETEQTYQDLRHSIDTPWERNVLLDQLATTRQVLEEYAHINEVKLGRKGPGRRGGVDKFFMVERQHVQSTLELIDQADFSNLAALRDALRQTRHNLELIGSQKIEDVLAGVIESLPSLALELGKEVPHCTIKSNGIMVRTQAAALLKNVFMHLYRNSMDHGIETGKERVEQGKAPGGQIDLAVSMLGGQLALRLHDDGRGLAIDRIRRKAQERGLIEENSAASPSQLAQLILMPGFSTAEHVTEVSGRGVGMDAVTGFVKAEGGSLSLVIQDETSDQDFVPFETVLLLPGKFAVAPVLRLLQQTA